MAIEPAKLKTNYTPIGAEISSAPQGMEIGATPRSNNVVQPSESNLSEGPEGTIMTGGAMSSPNFSKGVAGWKIRSDGSVEFGDGVFRGEITADKITSGGLAVVVGTDESIQDAIDECNTAGGGQVLLETGTHTLTADLTMYSNVYLRGQSAESTIIDCNSGAYSIIVKGSNAYTTGTIAITNGTTAVVGSGTVFTAAMVGRYILIGGLWYQIATYTDATHIGIALPYVGANVSGASTLIATIINDVYLEKFTIKGSTTAAIEVQYANEVWHGDLSIQTSAIGIDINDCSQVDAHFVDLIYCATGFDIDNNHYGVFESNGIQITTSGNGWELNDCSNLVCTTNYVVGCTGDGVVMQDCEEMGFVSSTIRDNGGQGVELVSGNDNIIFQNCGFVSNTSDGIKLTATSDNCLITGGFIKNNGGYGINIANANCDDNDIRGNRFSGNTSGDFDDNGTGTLKETFVYAAGTNVIQSANTERTTTATIYTKKKEIAVAKDGTVTVDFEMINPGSKLIDTDSTVGEQSPDTNNGSLTTLSIGDRPTYARETRSLLETSLVDHTSPTTAAYLYVYVDSFSEWTSKTVYAERITASWDESTVTWNNQPATTTTNRGSLVIAGTESGWIKFDITTIVQGWIAETFSNYGIMLKTDGTGSDANNEGMSVISSEHATTAHRPYIKLDDSGLDIDGKGRTYLNGVAEGTERTATGDYVNYSENIDVSKGDLVQLYTKVDNQGEDYTDYTEHEESSNFLTVTSDTITITNGTSDEEYYVYKDFGSAYFSEDFEMNLDVNFSAIGNNCQFNVVALINNVTDGGDPGMDPGLFVNFMVQTSGTDKRIRLYENYSSSGYSDEYTSMAFDTDYFLKFKRDESVGTHGTLYCDIYSSAADRTAETGAVDNLVVTLHGKTDFRYLYAAQSVDISNSNTISGTIKNLTRFTGDSVSIKNFKIKADAYEVATTITD